MGDRWDELKDEIMGEIGKLRRRIKTLDQIVRARHVVGGVAPHNVAVQRIILGHMHALPEPWPKMWRGVGLGDRMSSIPDRFDGYRAEEEPITAWQIADSHGKVLEIIHVDGNHIETDIAARVRKFEEKNPGPPTEPPALTEEQRQQAKRQAETGWFKSEAEALQQHVRFWEESCEQHARHRQEEERVTRLEVWTASALEAARKVFPVCDLETTGCGYNIVL